jgi:DNA-binding transcriptional ArsR family regulator
VASLIGDPTRIAMLAAPAEGRSLPAGDLARRAGVHPATATAHLRRLVEGGLVVVRSQAKGGELKLFTLPDADTIGLDSPVELHQ